MPTLHWLTRDTDLHAAARAPYRLLEEAPDLSAGDPEAGNLLVQGDNLEALKALLPFYAGQVKCGNVLTRASLAVIRRAIARQDAGFAGPLTVYGARSRLLAATLERQRVTFKQVPYHVRAWT